MPLVSKFANSANIEGRKHFREKFNMGIKKNSEFDADLESKEFFYFTYCVSKFSASNFLLFFQQI